MNTWEKAVKTKNGNPNLEDSNGALTDELLGNGDTEIFSTLIPMMKNVTVLKTCRLVCKSWNELACRALRKLPSIYYAVDESDSQETKAHLNLMKENVHLGLPSPFRNFLVNVAGLEKMHFLRFLQYLRETKDDFWVDLCILGRKVNQAELQMLLSFNQKNVKITTLELGCQIIDDSSDIFQPDDIRLPYLKKLTIGSLNSERIAKLCENVCRYSPLKTLEIQEDAYGEQLNKVMGPGGMKSVEELYISLIYELTSPEVWNNIWARIMEIPRLKKLEVDGLLEMDDNFRDGFVAVVDHFADSLESLTGDYLPSFSTKCFPKLREIENKLSQSVCSYPVDRYPVLKKATFRSCYGKKFRYSVVEESPGIENLSFLSSKTNELFNFMCSAGAGFPNVSHLFIEIEELFTPAMLSVLCKSFPRLSALELEVRIENHRTLSGLRINFDKWLEEGLPVEKIPREASLLDLSGLKELCLGAEVIISTSLFVHCLSKLSKLQYLSFYWNRDVSAWDVHDSVGHLTRIQVLTMDNTKKSLKEMERLQRMLPAVVEIS